MAGSWHVGVPVLAVVGPLFVFTKANRGLRPYGGQLLPSDRGGQDVFPWANAVGVLLNVRALRCLSKGHPSRRALFTLYLLSRGLGQLVRPWAWAGSVRRLALPPPRPHGNVRRILVPVDPVLGVVDRVVPGPGHYAVHNAQYRINGHKNAPNITMGTRWWQSKAPNRSGPGPGSYKLPQAAGKQIESKKRSSTGVAFGKASQRPNVQENTDGIGPGEYVLPSTIGRQKLSTVRSEPAIGFCKDKQRPDYSKDGNAYVPGPGQYKYSVQKCPVYKRAPIVSLSSRTKFGSVYG